MFCSLFVVVFLFSFFLCVCCHFLVFVVYGLLFCVVRCLVVVSCFLFVVRVLPMVVCCSLNCCSSFVLSCLSRWRSLCVVCCLLFDVCRSSLFVRCCSLLVELCSLIVARCSLYVSCCVLSVARCLLRVA